LAAKRTHSGPGVRNDRVEYEFSRQTYPKQREFDGKTRMFYNVIASGAKQSNEVNARVGHFL
jgi:hypothetical protein